MHLLFDNLGALSTVLVFLFWQFILCDDDIKND